MMSSDCRQPSAKRLKKTHQSRKGTDVFESAVPPSLGRLIKKFPVMNITEIASLTFVGYSKSSDTLYLDNGGISGTG